MTNHLIDLYICVYDVFVLASLGLAQTVESQNEEDSWCLVSVKSGLLPAQVTDNKVENGLFFLCGEIPVLFICAFFFFLNTTRHSQSIQMLWLLRIVLSGFYSSIGVFKWCFVNQKGSLAWVSGELQRDETRQ